MSLFNIKFKFTIIVVFITLKVNAQKLDSLSHKNFNELSDLFYYYENDSLIALKIANLYLKKAKLQVDTIKIANGFYFLSSIYKNNEKQFLNYNDSIIFLTKRLNTKFYPVTGYFNKGDYYYKKRFFYKSLRNYLLAVFTMT